MPPDVTLADVLQYYMRHLNYPYTPGLLSKFSGVPKATIVNWLEGQVVHPRHWQDLLRIADVLRLDETAVNSLLRAAGYPEIDYLLKQAMSDSDRLLFTPWFKTIQQDTCTGLAQGFYLPASPTPFIGRAELLTVVQTQLQHPSIRLLTLTGPAGTGKTRIALQTAVQMQADFADGVFFVDLAPLSDPQLVAPAIIRTIGIPESKDSLFDGMVAYLRPRQVMLLLDNFEHVLAAAPLITDLLAAAPQLKVLVTSRVVLRLYGEHEFAVSPMQLPDISNPPDAEQLMAYEAIDLFVQRAQAVDPSFALTAANAQSVVEICQRLDGLPLAIELAAARIKLLSPHSLLERLADRLGLLTWGARNLPQRHQTLRGTLDWSYRLLDPPTQHLFAQLAIFCGGCTIDAAEGVCGGVEAEQATGSDQSVLDGLMTLADNSMLRQIVDAEGELRYRMLETIREYARERLEQSGEAEMLWQRYAAYYLAFAQMIEPLLGGPQQKLWLQRLEYEVENFRAVCEWMLRHGQAENVAQLGGALWEFWRIRGFLSEGRRCLEAALVNSEQLVPATRAKACLAAGRLARQQGDLACAATHLEQSLALQRALGDTSGIARVLGHLGVVAYDQGQFERARMLHSESRTLWRELGDMRGEAITLANLGEVARHLGAYQQSIAFQEQSFALFHQLDDLWGIALVQSNIGMMRYVLGDYDNALRALIASLRRCIEIGEQEGMAACLERIARIDVVQKRGERAALLSGVAAQLRKQIGAPLPLSDRTQYEHDLRPARVELGEDRFTAQQEVGRETSLDQIVALLSE
ncbi:MAG: tetratricopeptide repeat protein [Chloroflexales bacterium]|nr:tetratricopeptide repeat protein [Chloroflexales bacterium]